ncbi:MAG TPA: SRPBCC family protein [Aquabacterium sp.]|uniref:SRPBCC family protein n=1 Tax=Aquabacterium sp. TaxID=1872578 RepID=UPI002E2EE045|nr:SRPBCC family protein [Aquabacterium sp.]HEX5354987.1 SRPBCC family protein [Aquabacterium sp.]
MRTLTLTVDINVEPDAVMAYASDPRHLPEWAPGFARSVTPDGDEWLVQMNDGLVRLWFTPANADGILDHVVRLPNGEEVMNTMRVVPKGCGSEVSFLLHQRPGMSEAQFAEDAALVQADLQRLKDLLDD